MPRGVKQPIHERIAYYTMPSTDVRACFEWFAATNRGRPVISKFRGRMEFVARLLLEEKLGRKLHDGEVAMHICNNPACVNPAHIFAGTQAENLLHMQQENRGLRHETTADLLAQLLSGDISITHYAEQAGISVQAASQLRKRRLRT